MAEITADVKVNFKILNKYSAALRVDGPFRKKVYKLAAVRYRSAMQERYDKFSRGGGNWPPLKTKRKRGDIEKASILRDTNTLFRVLTPVFSGLSGQVEKPFHDGITLGFGGSAKHSGGVITIGALARIHHAGLGNNPKRKLLDDAPKNVTDGIEKDIVRLHKRFFNTNGSIS